MAGRDQDAVTTTTKSVQKFDQEWRDFITAMQQDGDMRWKPMVLVCEREVESDEDEESEWYYIAAKEVFDTMPATEAPVPVPVVAQYLRWAADGLEDK